MKLNIHIIWDELQESGGELVATQDILSFLCGVRLLERADIVPSEQFLYLIDTQTFSHLPAVTGRLNFICIGTIDRSVLEERGWSAILLPGDTDRYQVFRILQGVFEKYAQWERDMLLAMANSESLQSIFDTGARFLRNPIALFDTSLAFVMKAGTLPPNIESTIWEEVLSQGYTRMENVPLEEQRIMAHLLATSDGPFFVQGQGQYNNHQQIVASLKRSGTQFGTFGMIDINEPFTLGQLSIVSHLKYFMELATKTDLHLKGITEGSSYFVERLLQGLAVEENAVAYHLRKKNWFIKDEFGLLYFTRTDNSQIDESMHDMYAFRIRLLMDDALMFPYENGILAISHKDAGIRNDRRFLSELSSLLKNIGLCCGASLVFHDFMSLKYAFIQSKTALTSPVNGLKPQVYLFETQYTDHIIKALDASTSLKSLCHPKILQLYQVIGGKGEEYVRCLQTYLINGRNTTATAAKLSIHRNTLLYRLERIKGIIGMDLETADEEILFLLYVSCLILQRNVDR